MPSADVVIAIAKQSGVYLLKALLVWLGVFLLIALLSLFRFRETTYPFTIGWVRFVNVLWPCLLAFLVVALILTAFRTDEAFSELAAAIQWSVKTGAILLGVAAVIVGLIAAVATFESQDPWRYLPGGPPPALMEFARQHPDLRVTDWGDFGVAVEDRESNRVILSRWDLLEPAFSLEKCADASEPARMGGPPPLPGSKCLLRIRIIKPDYDALSDEEADRDVVPPQLHRTIYVYSIGWIGADKVEEHFRGWIKSAGLEGNYSHYQTNHMEVEVGGGKWSISVIGQRKRPKDIYVEYAEHKK